MSSINKTFMEIKANKLAKLINKTPNIHLLKTSKPNINLKAFIIYGCVGVGKTTASEYIRKKYPNIKQFEPSCRLKNFANIIFPFMNMHFEKEVKLGINGETGRDFLIQFSTLIKKFYPNYWISGIKDFETETHILVNGVRFEDEYNYICNMCGKENVFVLNIYSENDIKTNDIIEEIPFTRKLLNEYNEVFFDDIDTIFSEFLNPNLSL